MVVRTTAASPKKRTKPLAEPRIDAKANPATVSTSIGSISIGARVSISPAASVRADEGTPFHIGDDSSIQDGAVIHGLKKSRVVGDDGKDYSVWIGAKTCITHLALVHGPAYVGDGCFIGFRSTVFNARVGAGCIVMMHTLVQDVEIPPGKFVPSGAVITHQQQADRLPDITEIDRAFVRNIVEIGEPAGAIPKGKRESRPIARPEPAINVPNETSYKNSVTTMSVNTNIRAQVRSLLSQGYKIGVEYADKRRFKTSSWLSAGFLEGHREEQIAAALEDSLKDLQGQYVRLIGVDPAAKRRVLEMIVQRPEDTPGEPARTTTAVHGGRSDDNGSDLSVQVRSLLAQGFKIGTEHADKRRFKTSSWLTGPAIESKSEAAILRDIQSLLADHSDEYVRLIGIDPQAKKRVVELIIQRPGESAKASDNGASYSAPASNGKTAGIGQEGLSSATIGQIRSLLAQGYKIGTEHADKRRFKTSSWQSCTPIESNRESDVIAALEVCLREHQGEYVRLLGIDANAKRRVLEAIIQRPDGPAASNGSKTAATVTEPAFKNYAGSATATLTQTLTAETIGQIRSLLDRGYKIGSEHADKRRFKTGSWQSCPPIESRREADVIASLETCLRDHQGEYVRLIGIDPQAKRRVLETVIQRP